MTRTFSLLALVALAFSCEQVIEIDIPKRDPVLVINSLFSPDSVLTTTVSQSIGIQDPGTPPMVTNAQVVLFEEGTPVDTFTHLGDGNYRSHDFLATVGKTYRMEATAPGFKPVHAESTVPNPVVPGNITYQDSIGQNTWGVWEGTVTLDLSDLPGTDDFYGIALYTLDSFDTGTDTLIFVNTLSSRVQDPTLNAEQDYWGILFTDESFQGKTRQIKIRVDSDSWNWATNLHLAVLHLTREYYQYNVSRIRFYQAQDNPFAEPARIFSNISDGLGIFAAYSQFDLKVR